MIRANEMPCRMKAGIADPGYSHGQRLIISPVASIFTIIFE